MAAPALERETQAVSSLKYRYDALKDHKPCATKAATVHANTGVAAI